MEGLGSAGKVAGTEEKETRACPNGSRCSSTGVLQAVKRNGGSVAASGQFRLPDHQRVHTPGCRFRYWKGPCQTAR